MAETSPGGTQQPEAAVSEQEDVEASSPTQRRLKKRGGAAAGRQGRKASSSEAPVDQEKQTGQAKASKGTAMPAGAKAEEKGVPKLFS